MEPRNCAIRRRSKRRRSKSILRAFDSDSHLTEDVAIHRKMTEVRLLQLLQRAQTDSPIDMIQSVVSGYHQTRFNTFSLK